MASSDHSTKLPLPKPFIRHGSRVQTDSALGLNFWNVDHNSQDLVQMHFDGDEQELQSLESWLDSGPFLSSFISIRLLYFDV